MATLKKYDFSGQEVGEVQIDDELLQHQAHAQMIKDYLVAIRKNQRQWSANTKERAEIRCTGKKPYAQKGTGRARQGYFAAPQYKGGGIVFGPKPKFDLHTRINKKERQKVIAYLLAQKVEENRVVVLERPQFDQPKTKKAAEFLKALKLSGKRVLFLGECFPLEEEGAGWIKDREGLQKSLRNIQRTQFAQVPNINGYDLAKFQTIVLMEPAIEEFKAILGKNHGKKSL